MCPPHRCRVAMIFRRNAVGLVACISLSAFRVITGSTHAGDFLFISPVVIVKMEPRSAEQRVGALSLSKHSRVGRLSLQFFKNRFHYSQSPVGPRKSSPFGRTIGKPENTKIICTSTPQICAFL